MLTNTSSREFALKISGITKTPFAILGPDGSILARSKNFRYGSDIINIKNSKKAIPLALEGEKVGYLYLDTFPHIIAEEKDVLKSMLELLMHQHTVLENVTTEDRKINKFIYDLLHQEGYDENQAMAEGHVYGFDLKESRSVLIVDLSGDIKKTLYSESLSCNEKDSFWARVKRSLAFSASSFYTRNKNNIVAYIGGSRFVIIKDLGREEDLKENFRHILQTLNSFQFLLKSEFRSEVTIGVGKYYPGIKGLKDSFEESLVAMNFGEQVWGKDKVYSFDSFGVVAPLINSGKGLDFPKNIFENFSSDELKKTLSIFFDNDMSLTRTAKELKIHRNTLVYRLDKIAESLKLDPRVFDDAVQIRLSMLFGEIIR